jgi:hypothetical protein
MTSPCHCFPLAQEEVLAEFKLSLGQSPEGCNLQIAQFFLLAWWSGYSGAVHHRETVSGAISEVPHAA